MAPGIVQKSERIADASEVTVPGEFVSEVVAPHAQIVATTPINPINGLSTSTHFGRGKTNGLAQNGELDLKSAAGMELVTGEAKIVEEVTEVEEVKVLMPLERPVRRVVRPKVLKNLESHNYLYDRLYDDTCPHVVSAFSRLDEV